MPFKGNADPRSIAVYIVLPLVSKDPQPIKGNGSLRGINKTKQSYKSWVLAG